MGWNWGEIFVVEGIFLGVLAVSFFVVTRRAK
jgi:hypothetical protein